MKRKLELTDEEWAALTACLDEERENVNDDPQIYADEYVAGINSLYAKVTIPRLGGRQVSTEHAPEWAAVKGRYQHVRGGPEVSCYMIGPLDEDRIVAVTPDDSEESRADAELMCEAVNHVLAARRKRTILEAAGI